MDVGSPWPQTRGARTWGPTVPLQLRGMVVWGPGTGVSWPPLVPLQLQETSQRCLIQGGKVCRQLQKMRSPGDADAQDETVTRDVPQQLQKWGRKPRTCPSPEKSLNSCRKRSFWGSKMTNFRSAFVPQEFGKGPANDETRKKQLQRAPVFP